jgi:hypothetical protein
MDRIAFKMITKSGIANSSLFASFLGDKASRKLGAIQSRFTGKEYPLAGMGEDICDTYV